MQVRIPTRLNSAGLKSPGLNPAVLETQAQDLTLEPGQLVLAVGGSKSGKSKLLEKWAQETAQVWQTPLWYLATLEVGEDPENQARVDRHRSQRAGKGFETIEASCNLTQSLQAYFPQQDSKRPVLLLECLGTLLANEIFSPRNQGRQAAWGLPPTYVQAPDPGLADQIARDLLEDLSWLSKQTSLLFIASNDVFSNCPPPDPWSRLWLEALGLVHQGLAQGPTCFLVEVAAGIALACSGPGLPQGDCPGVTFSDRP